MIIHVVSDNPANLSAIKEIAGPFHRVVGQMLGIGPDIPAALCDALVMDVGVETPLQLEKAKAILARRDDHKTLFIVDKASRVAAIQASAFGARTVLSRPFKPQDFLFELSALANAPHGHAGIAIPAPGASALNDSAKVFSFLFADAGSGSAIKLHDAEAATSQIIESVESGGLTHWLTDVRQHHQGTYQHCLLVSGVAVAFALSLGFGGADTHKLGMAATLHDVGKARIPLAILDKPGALDDAEMTLMKRHPEFGYDMLKNIPGLHADILDGTLHHHEYLDGSGYPDGLRGAQISDVVRLLTIADIFAALIEERAYHKPMSREGAYGVLCDMDGKLETSLLKAFRRVALTG